MAVGAISSTWVVIGHDKIPIPRDELPGALVHGKTRTLSLRSGDRTIAVRPAQRPLLEMLVDKDACARIAACERGRVVQRLENVSLEEGALRFCEYENGDIVAEPRDLVAVELRLKNAGGASAGILAHPDGTGSKRLVGPRLAPELILPSRRDVIRLEFQAAYGNVFSESNRWFPWGGVAYARWF